jgi:hypothetical protein
MARADYTGEDVVRRGRRLYEERVRPQIAARDEGKFLAINIETEDWVIGEDTMSLTMRLHDQNPDAALYTMRIGYPATGRIGSRLPGRKP